MSTNNPLLTYVTESLELLEQIENALLVMEQGRQDSDLVNELFRAVHTVKGSAGLFGLDHIVNFTHVVETVLDKLRAGEIKVEGDFIAVLLECRDHIEGMIRDIEGGIETLRPARQDIDASLLDRLARHGGTRRVSQGKAETPSPTAASAAKAIGYTAENDHWHISLRFDPKVMHDGFDPLSFIRYLDRKGKIKRVFTLTETLPALDILDAELCYLGFEIAYQSDLDKAAIESVFDFVRQDATIRILPPHSQVSEYVMLISQSPEPNQRLGEILVNCGTLTQQELAEALALQAKAQQNSGASDAMPTPLGEILVEEHMVRPAVVKAALEKQQQSRITGSAVSNVPANGGASDVRSVRVDADKLDCLVNLVGELVIAGAATQVVAKRIGNEDMVNTISNLERLVEQVRDSALNLRMVQIGATFNRFQRVVRDISRELGKEINLVITGAETELDKTVVERLSDPLLHLVRNSMDHGLESPAEREAKGKSREGRLMLNAYHDSGSIVIEVSDDGRGLNREKIRAKAIDRGMIGADQTLSEHELDNLIFEPGFSTADAVSNLSGRGVGMDVVKRSITALRGTINVETHENQGTKVRVRLPLTLAIIEGFHVAVGKSSYVIPLDMVVECIERPEGTVSQSNYLNLRGEVLPFIHLGDFFSCREPGKKTRENIVVVQYSDQRAGLVVDTLLGELQAVIKPMGKLFSHVKGIGGSTILGTGEVALVLDVPGLIGMASDKESAAA
ncbi:MAG: chemotaxis protein CheA [Gammaproteobacteria bacterium]|nr:chemotaxis protein CheA [Gammaproteobacteria bacterium]